MLDLPLSDGFSPDLYTVVVADHERLADLAEQVRQAPDPAPLVRELAELFRCHALAAEDELAQFVGRAPGGDHDVAREIAAVSDLLARLETETPGSSEFLSLADEVADRLDGHSRAEEEHLLPFRELLDPARLVELGEAFADAQLDHLYGPLG